MLLGEALTLRARQAQKLNDLQGRIKGAAMVQEGDDPPEDCTALIGAYRDVSEEHRALNLAITVTNHETIVEGRSLAALLQEREGLLRHRNILRLVCAAASPSNREYRYMRSEVKLVPQVDVAVLRKEEEEVQDEANKLDAKIQAVNWETELIEV